MRAYLQTLDMDLDIMQPPCVAAYSADHTDSCSVDTSSAVPFFPQSKSQQQPCKLSEGPYLVRCTPTSAASSLSHSAAAAQQAPSTPRPSCGGSSSGNISRASEHSADSPLLPTGLYGDDPAPGYKCSEAWPKWAWDLTLPKEWSSSRIVVGTRTQPKRLAYLSSTCSDGSGDGCDCDCKDCEQAQADSDTAPATCVALACLPLSLGLSCGDHSTGRGFTCSAVNAAAAAGPSYPTAQPMAPLLSSLATPQGALRRTGVPLSFFPFPSSLGLSCGDHSTGHGFACEWGQGLCLSSLGHSAADLKLQFPELPSEEELDTAYCTLHLKPLHLVQG